MTSVIQVSQVVTEVGNNLARAQAITNQLALAPGPLGRERLNARSTIRSSRGLSMRLAELERLPANDAAAERTPVKGLEVGWRRFLALPRHASAAAGPAADGEAGRHFDPQVLEAFLSSRRLEAVTRSAGR